MRFVFKFTCCVLCLIAAGLWIADRAFPLHDNSAGGAATVVLDRNGEPLRTFADHNGVWRYPVSIDQVSPRYIDALLTYEDRYFYQHPGVNPLSLLRAGWQWFSEGRIISGGSTLTMQVARLHYPSPRSVRGKLQQILRALQLEWHLSKDEILTLYLNKAPFGGTIEGVQAASLQYLQKPASQLRFSEAALLAVLPQAPSRLRPDRHPKLAQQYRDKVLDRLLSFQIWGEESVKRAKQEDVAVWPLSNPIHAPLLSRRLKQSEPENKVIRSTIDSGIQQQFSDQIKRYVSRQAKGISAAALLVDNQSRQVISYVGSADFLNEQRFGHVDMVTAIRSPGSTLKPFLYGLSLDDSLIHSESLLADVPIVTGQYRPGNFSQGFSGPVSASSALQRSLNLPFVQMIQHYDSQRFANKLDHVGASLRIPGGRANPAIILGGAGSSLEHLVTLYTSLANSGRVAPLKYSVAGGVEDAGDDESGQLPRQLMSTEAAWITWNALANIDPPDQFIDGYSRAHLPKIGWKTGTSWDYRDVWAVGVSKRYTLGVWLGRPDGSPMEKTMGRVLAGPLLFQLYQLLESEADTITKPEDVVEQSVCWPDGRVVMSSDQACDQIRVAYTIAKNTPRTLDPEPLGQNRFYNPQYNYLVDQQSGLRVTRECDIGPMKSQSSFVWPAAMEPWISKQWRRDERIPLFNSECKTILQTSALLRLHGINPQQVYHTNGLEMIEVDVRAEGREGSLNWYLNGKLLEGSSNKQKLTLQGGQTYQLYVQSISGASAQIEFIVL
ncbi:penicillin-binding protein 1C [Neptuniibacter sp. QD34_54]|uniref:penicillin-binding protein 1C n=1 Tax=Neptuniibacter sp. QD34_54 TaxID=3398208 RepID=UPI0039F5F438